MRVVGIFLIYCGLASLFMTVDLAVVSGLHARSEDPLVRAQGEFGKVAVVFGGAITLASTIWGAHLCRRRR
jgi:hypothetical protein